MTDNDGLEISGGVLAILSLIGIIILSWMFCGCTMNVYLGGKHYKTYPETKDVTTNGVDDSFDDWLKG